MMLVNFVYKPGRHHQYRKLQIIEEGRMDDLSRSEYVCTLLCHD